MAWHPKPFEARWDGRCGLCDDDIYKGDDVTYWDDELCHVDCVDDV